MSIAILRAVSAHNLKLCNIVLVKVHLLQYLDKTISSVSLVALHCLLRSQICNNANLIKG